MGGLAFLQAAFLAGLAAAAIPVAIHLMHRRRSRTVPFPTLRFLREIDSRTARRSRLREKAVLAARVAVLLLLALALARPVLRGSGALGRGRTSAVFVIDNSLSMEARAGGTSALERSRLTALEVLRGLDPADRAAVVPLHAGAAGGGTPRPGSAPALTEDHRALEREVRGVGSTSLATPLREAIGLAYRLLAEDRNPVKEVFVLSDLQASAFPSGEAFPAPPPDVKTVLLVPRAPEEPNLTVSDASLPPGSGRKAHVRVKVRNFGGAEASTTLTVKIDGKTLEERSLRVPARGEASLLLGPYPLAPGLHAGEAALGEDPLPADGTRAFAADIPPAMRVVLARDPGARAAHLDPAFYLARALRPLVAGGSAAVRVTTTAALAGEDLSAADVVVLAEPARVGTETARVLDAFVRRGGGLLFIAGPGEAPEDLRALAEPLPGTADGGSAAPLLPARLEEVVTRPEPFRIREWSRSHPALEPLASATPPLQLDVPRFTSYRKAAAVPGATVLARFDSGDPALLESMLGRGRVILLATTARPGWNDLPLKFSFVPLVHSLLRRLAATGGEPLVIAAGSPLVLRWPAGSAPDAVRLVAPGSAAHPAHENGGPRPKAEPGKEPELDLGPLEEPGFYGIEEVRGTQTERRAVVVRTDLAESDLQRLPAERMAELFPGAPVIEVDGGGAAAAARALEVTGGSELKNFLLLVLLALVLLEPVLANRVAFRRARDAEAEASIPAAPAGPVTPSLRAPREGGGPIPGPSASRQPQAFP